MDRKRTFKDEDPIDEYEDPLKSIEQTIFHVGDKHPSLSVTEDLQVCAGLVADEYTKYGEALVDAIVACALELPHKASIYAELTAHLHSRSCEVGGLVVNGIAAALQKAADEGNWRHLVQALRFLAESARLQVVDRESLLETTQGLVGCMEKGDLRGSYAAWMLLAISPWLDSSDRASLLARASVFTQQGLADLDNLFLAASKRKEPPSPIESAGTLKLPAISWTGLAVDANWDPRFEPLEIFKDAFHEEIDQFERWHTFLVFRELMETFELNHRKATDMLLAAAGEEVGHPEKMVATFLFGELLRGQRGMRRVCYEVALMNCCRRTCHFPPMLARAVQGLVERLGDLGFVKSERLATWFAHQLSNFDFKWNWDEWSDIRGMGETEPKLIFVKSTLEKLVRLSFPDRIKEVVPEWLRDFLPPAPEPEPVAESPFLSALQSRASAAEVEALLDSEPDLHKGKELFLRALLSAGAKTPSHTLLMIERYLAILQKLNPRLPDRSADLAEKMFTISVVAAFWHTSALHFEYAIERLVHYRIVTPAAVFKWMCETVDRQLSDPHARFSAVLLFSWNWNIISTTLEQAAAFPLAIQKKLAAAKDEATCQKLQTTMRNLDTEFADAVVSLVQQLDALKEQIVADGDITSAARRVAASMIAEIRWLYPQSQIGLY